MENIEKMMGESYEFSVGEQLAGMTEELFEGKMLGQDSVSLLAIVSAVIKTGKSKQARDLIENALGHGIVIALPKAQEDQDARTLALRLAYQAEKSADLSTLN